MGHAWVASEASTAVRQQMAPCMCVHCNTSDTQATAPNCRHTEHERTRMDARMRMDATRIELM